MSEFRSLLPPNATALELALERALGRRLDSLPTPVRDAWNADAIDLAALPWLAWGVGMRSWNAAWPAAVRRQLVKTAIPRARRMGSVASVRAVVNAFGGSLVFREWWETTPRGEPHTFSLVLNLSDGAGGDPSAEFVEDVVREITRAKPARSHFTITQGLRLVGGVGVVGAVRAVVYRRLEFTGAV